MSPDSIEAAVLDVLPQMKRSLETRLVKQVARLTGGDTDAVSAAIDTLREMGYVQVRTINDRGRLLRLVEMTQAGFGARAQLILAKRRAGA